MAKIRADHCKKQGGGIFAERFWHGSIV
jgi:hypothetical protein